MKFVVTAASVSSIVFASPLITSQRRAPFSLMDSWSGGTDTNLGGQETPVGDQLDPRDANLCKAILKKANSGDVPPRELNSSGNAITDPLGNPPMPSGFKQVKWSVISKPTISPDAHKLSEGDPLRFSKEDAEVLRLCDAKVGRPGWPAYTCQFSAIRLKGRNGIDANIIRLTRHYGNEKLTSQDINYFFSDRSDRIIKEFPTYIGAVSVININRVNYLASWGQEDLDFSSGYGDRRFRRVRTTLQIAEITTLPVEKIGAMGFKICVFSLRSARR